MEALAAALCQPFELNQHQWAACSLFAISSVICSLLALHGVEVDGGAKSLAQLLMSRNWKNSRGRTVLNDGMELPTVVARLNQSMRHAEPGMIVQCDGGVSMVKFKLEYKVLETLHEALEHPDLCRGIVRAKNHRGSHLMRIHSRYFESIMATNSWGDKDMHPLVPGELFPTFCACYILDLTWLHRKEHIAKTWVSLKKDSAASAHGAQGGQISKGGGRPSKVGEMLEGQVVGLAAIPGGKSQVVKVRGANDIVSLVTSADDHLKLGATVKVVRIERRKVSKGVGEGMAQA
jgi:hypothetical protein